MKTKQLIDAIWEHNQDLTFGEVRRVASVVNEAAEIEIIKIRRANFARKAKKSLVPNPTKLFPSPDADLLRSRRNAQDRPGRYHATGLHCRFHVVSVRV